MNSNDLRTQLETENSSGVLVSNKTRGYLLRSSIYCSIQYRNKF